MLQSLAAWVEYLDVELGCLPTTIERYTRVLDVFVAYCESTQEIKEFALGALGKQPLKQFLRWYCQRQGAASASSWNLGLAALRSFYGFLFEEEIIDVNPALRIRRRKIRKHRKPLPLSLDEFLALTDAANGASELYRLRNVAIATVFFHCGIRVTELRLLNLTQLDFQNGFLLDVRLKGDKSIAVNINDEVKTALKRYLAHRHRFEPAADETALFLSDRGRRISKRALQEMVKTYSQRAGITRPVGCHLLRHSNATVLSDLGVSLPAIQELYDHESISTTRRYVYVREPTRRRAAERLSKHVAKHRERRQKSAA